MIGVIGLWVGGELYEVEDNIDYVNKRMVSRRKKYWQWNMGNNEGKYKKRTGELGLKEKKEEKCRKN